MAAYSMKLGKDQDGDILRVAFDDPAKGDVVMRDAAASLDVINFGGGRLLRVTGPASLPVAMAIAHVTAHRYGAVACFDPKMSGYIVAISHDPDFPVGTVIEKGEAA